MNERLVCVLLVLTIASVGVAITTAYLGLLVVMLAVMMGAS